MGIVYPGEGIDAFTTPSAPEYTSLSEAGDTSRNHDENHHDIGLAVEALEANAAPLPHDHSGTDPSGPGLWPTEKLLQANTHESADTDGSIVSLHHTLGTGPTQAAAGNHAHDYQGPSIFNQALIRCTSTTRPIDPYPGLQIWETDTNCARVWAAFPNNTLVQTVTPGLNYTYTFDSANSVTALDPAIFSQSYPLGTAPANGAMGAPAAGDCAWHIGTNTNCRSIARAIVSNNSTTLGDDQVLTFVTGSITMQGRYDWGFVIANPSPTNDAYLRMSADGQSYVRFSLNDVGVTIFYTTSGPAGETFLGGVHADTDNRNTTWMCKAVGSTYTIYRNGQLVLASVDYRNAINVGASYRGWGIGMTGAHNPFTWIDWDANQIVPNSLASVNISDNNVGHVVYGYTTTYLWQLLPQGYTPVVHAESRTTTQVVRTGERHICWWTDIIEDFFWWLHLDDRRYLKLETSNTDIVVQEPGHYHIHASICWDPFNTWNDHGMVSIEVNGVDISRKNWKWIRGPVNPYAGQPGFSQTHEIVIHWYLALGDVVRVVVKHNANRDCFLWWSNDFANHNAQVSYVELVFVKP